MGTTGLHLETEWAADLAPAFEGGMVIVETEDAQDSDRALRTEKLRDRASAESLRWNPVDRRPRSHAIDLSRKVIGALIEQASFGGDTVLTFLTHEDREWVMDKVRLLRTALQEVFQSRHSFSKQPHLKSQDGRVVARSRVIADAFLGAVDCCFDADALAVFLSAWPEHQRLEMGELWALKPALQISILDQLAGVIAPFLDYPAFTFNLAYADARIGIRRLITALRDIGEADWKLLFEQISVVDRVLRRDPVGTYTQMDYESRDLYRNVIADLACHSEMDEVEVAEAALSLAQNAVNRRIRERENHVGYYLVDGGLPDLRQLIRYRAPIRRRLTDALRNCPNLFYLTGIGIFTIVIEALFLAGLKPLASIGTSFFWLLILASQAASTIMNAIVTSILPARLLPKLDFSEGIPARYKTMVAVPTLLLNEQQIKDLVNGLEVHYLGNRDPNLYFALLTDGPDSDKSCDGTEALAEYCSHLIRELNTKYAAPDEGVFFLFHRHRMFNPSEDAWMGWERKRGKLLDLNNLLRGTADRFPVKVGDLSVLPRIKFVITLDSDTKLPRDAAQRLVGTLAHPLHRAIINPITNTVTTGYGILQPRVGISLQSASRSRLAAIYGGNTGFDIYTRAVSDVYQDLYGEGTFAGKGIYDVDVFHQVLNERFPCNTLLSHDLIEGAYARAGLVSDIEVIEDYPSNFSAYSRRQHRWVRGDWQIMQWLLPRVPNFNGCMVANPTTLVSRWKIFDNLRRSLIDPGMFLLLLAAWFFPPEPQWYWILTALSLLLIPVYTQALLSLLGVRNSQQFRSTSHSAGATFARGHLHVVCKLIFLTHQALLMTDAIIRTLVRHRITRRKLLEWETAAEAECGSVRRKPADIYLGLTPWIALAITVALAPVRPEACLYNAPLLLMWASAPAIARRLSIQRMNERASVKSGDEQFLRAVALRTWRYFRENSGATRNWLVPDNIQESPAMVADRISPTNLGLLLNARQAAHGMGYITLPEFVRLNSRTLSIAERLPRHGGHFFNWYDIRTLDPLAPAFISTVDSGNLAACLWAFKEGCLSLMKGPIFPQSLWQGILDHVRILHQLDPAKTSTLNASVENFGADTVRWLAGLHLVELEAQQLLSAPDNSVRWWAAELNDRIGAVSELTRTFMPWFSSGGSSVACDLADDPEKWLASLTLETLPTVIGQIRARLSSRDLSVLQDALAKAVMTSERLQLELRRLASEAARLAEEMDFCLLYNRRKKLLSVGYDVPSRRLHTACYDLLASEARTAVFVAIAKGDIPQESWFHLGRAQTLYRGRRVLLSWTGTIFEYLMPSLWMKTSRQTILGQSMQNVVETQQLYLRHKCPFWGISESAHSEVDENGSYQYRAFGLPKLALKRMETSPRVIAPYASFLALETNFAAAIRNLRRMWQCGFAGLYGFYDAVEFKDNGSCRSELVPVKCWMAHHLAMSLIAVTNRLLGSPFQRYFHADPQVIATELLLHERVPGGMTVESDLAREPALGPLKQGIRGIPRGKSHNLVMVPSGTLSGEYQDVEADPMRQA
jgi:hypothetical protein